jgi:hypothetical protein
VHVHNYFIVHIMILGSKILRQFFADSICKFQVYDHRVIIFMIQYASYQLLVTH